MRTGAGNTVAVKNLIGLECRLPLSDIFNVHYPDPRGLGVCRRNTVIIYVNYDYCANNLMSRSYYEGGFRLLMPFRRKQMFVFLYAATRWPHWSCCASRVGPSCYFLAFNGNKMEICNQTVHQIFNFRLFKLIMA